MLRITENPRFFKDSYWKRKSKFRDFRAFAVSTSFSISNRKLGLDFLYYQILLIKWAIYVRSRGDLEGYLEGSPISISPMARTIENAKFFQGLCWKNENSPGLDFLYFQTLLIKWGKKIFGNYFYNYF